MFVESGAPQRDIHSIDSLIAWLETKNPDETYNYDNPSYCLLAQYYISMGKEAVLIDAVNMNFYGSGGDQRLPHGFERVAKPSQNGFFARIFGEVDESATFGQALNRACQVKAGKIRDLMGCPY
jgi:hypothetical protein